MGYSSYRVAALLKTTLLDTRHQLLLGHRRNLFEWLNIVWNRVDKQRVKELGPDGACAEWLMRNGAFVKWSGSNKLVTDYNAMEAGLPRRDFIKEIDATDASITAMGFPHFAGCKHIDRVTFTNCTYLDDEAMSKMAYLKESLKHLQITGNGNISDAGVTSLGILSNLESLVLFDLPAVRDKAKCVQSLTTNLPKCNIDFQ